MANYYGIIPAEIRYCKSLSSQAKLLYAEITSRTDCNNLCEINVRELAELYDTDEDGVERWILLLSKEKFLCAEKIVEEKSCRWRISLLFPERKIVQEKVVVKEKPKQTIPIEDLTPEQILRQHYDLAEIQKAFPQLDIENLEAPLWSAKLILKYGKKKVLKEPSALHQHFLRWISKSRHAIPDSGLIEIL